MARSKPLSVVLPGVVEAWDCESDRVGLKTVLELAPPTTLEKKAAKPPAPEAAETL